MYGCFFCWICSSRFQKFYSKLGLNSSILNTKPLSSSAKEFDPFFPGHKCSCPVKWCEKRRPFDLSLKTCGRKCSRMGWVLVHDDEMFMYMIYMGVSKNRGTPKSSILIGFSITNHSFWGKHPLFLGTPIYTFMYICFTLHSQETSPIRLGIY